VCSSGAETFSSRDSLQRKLAMKYVVSKKSESDNDKDYNIALWISSLIPKCCM